MKEGSALLVALALAAGIAYWSDHYRNGGWEATPATEGPFPYQPTLAPARGPAGLAVSPERLEVHDTEDATARGALCAELEEVTQGVEAALLHPQSPPSAEQHVLRRRAYIDKRIALGC